LSDISLNSGVTNMTVSLPLGKRHAVHRESSRARNRGANRHSIPGCPVCAYFPAGCAYI
jgi:hypothetical protein